MKETGLNTRQLHLSKKLNFILLIFVYDILARLHLRLIAS